MKIYLTILAILISTAMLTGQGIPYNQEFQVNTYSNSTQEHPVIAALSDGGFVICWDSRMQDGSKDGVFAQLYDAECNKVDQEFQVNTYTIDYQGVPSIATLSNGGFAISWASHEQDGWGNGVYAQLFNPAGHKVGKEFQVNTYTYDNQGNPSISSLSDGQFAVCWESKDQDAWGYGIFAQLFQPDGSKIGEEFQVNTNYDGIQWRPAIDGFSDGNFVVCWESPDEVGRSDIQAQLFNVDGSKNGAEFKVNSYTNDSQHNPTIKTLSDCGFVICWNSLEQDGSMLGVYAQIFNPDGSKAGDEFQVNSYTIHHQFKPCITQLTNGSFVICWNSFNQDGSAYGVYGQLFNPDGSKIGEEFQINNYTNNDQMNPNITTLSGGGFVICWESQGQDGSGAGVYATYFLSEPIIHELHIYEILNPANDNTFDSKRPTFTWQSPSDVRICYPWEIEYNLYLSTDQEFSNPLIYNGIQDTTYTFPKSDSLDAGQTYFWKVLAKNIAGDSLWSSNTNAFFVSHTATEVEEEAQLPTGFELEQNYPNPFNPETTVRYSLPQAGVVELKLYDITGREVMSLVNEWQSAGAHSVKVDGRNLASGVYVYTLTAGDYRVSKKMALVR